MLKYSTNFMRRLISLEKKGGPKVKQALGIGGLIRDKANNRFPIMKFGLGMYVFLPFLAYASITINTATVEPGDLIRAEDWNRMQLDLKSLANAIDILGAQNWVPNGNDLYYNGGKIGIGVTSPEASLHIYEGTPQANQVIFKVATSSDAERFSLDEDGDVSLDGDLLVRGSDIYDSAGNLELSAEDNMYLGIDWNDDDNADTGYIAFGKNSAGDSATWVDLMRITESGLVGIGTTSISAGLTLDIAGAIGATSFCDPDGNNCHGAETLGVSNCQVQNSAFTILGNDYGQGTYNCPLDFPNLVTGGCDRGGNDLIFDQSVPTATNGWTCRFYNNEASDRTAFAYGKCCK